MIWENFYESFCILSFLMSFLADSSSFCNVWVILSVLRWLLVLLLLCEDDYPLSVDWDALLLIMFCISWVIMMFLDSLDNWDGSPLVCCWSLTYLICRDWLFGLVTIDLVLCMVGLCMISTMVLSSMSSLPPPWLLSTSFTNYLVAGDWFSRGMVCAIGCLVASWEKTSLFVKLWWPDVLPMWY